jgi:hypothetical protein
VERLSSSHNIDFLAIFERCHSRDGAVYWTRRRSRYGHIVFVPTDRTDPECYVSPSINATELRRAFLSFHTAIRQFRDKKKHEVLNIDLLAIYLRQDYRWMKDWTWWRLVEHQDAEDDINVERMTKEKKERKKRDGEEAGKRAKRRMSFAL